MFTPLDNKAIGQSIAKIRNHREIKAVEVAKYLHLSPAAYTKYERGETNITIHFLNQIGQFFDINPVQLLQHKSDTIVENIHNSNFAVNGTVSTIDKQLIDVLYSQLVSKDTQIEKLTIQNEKLLDKIGK